jgi:hypothetical protein
MDKTPTAFPWTHDNITCTGMTLRDYFAAKVMQAYMSDSDMSWGRENYEFAARAAYQLADAMLKAREA